LFLARQSQIVNRAMSINPRVIPGFFSLFLLLHGSESSAQAIAHLYAARPPAGSAFIRLVNSSSSSLNIRIGSGAPKEELSSETQIATIYRIVPGNQPLMIEVNGRVAKNTISPPADKFATLIVKVVKNQFELKMIVEDTSPIDGLRAELRFYNVIDGCRGGLNVVDGPQIFEPAPADSSRHRSINPVEAILYGECERTRSSLWKLPSLKSGDHFSIFLIGDPANPKLVGQLDETEPYRGPTQ
jgi:alginate O-acetyltransferase complex protein AlgF